MSAGYLATSQHQMLPASGRHPQTENTISRRGPWQPRAITGNITIAIGRQAVVDDLARRLNPTRRGRSCHQRMCAPGWADHRPERLRRDIWSAAGGRADAAARTRPASRAKPAESVTATGPPGSCQSGWVRPAAGGTRIAAVPGPPDQAVHRDQPRHIAQAGDEPGDQQQDRAQPGHVDRVLLTTRAEEHDPASSREPRGPETSRRA
jgi:hypothetical protein